MSGKDEQFGELPTRHRESNSLLWAMLTRRVMPRR